MGDLDVRIEIFLSLARKQKNQLPVNNALDDRFHLRGNSRRQITKVAVAVSVLERNEHMGACYLSLILGLVNPAIP